LNKFIFASAVVFCLAGMSLAQAEPSMLRIACDDDSAGAEITINGAFKGECPLDMQVKPGTVQLRAVKKMGAGRERHFNKEFRIGEGVVKRIDVQLDAPQFTAEGKRQEDARLAREREEVRRASEEKRRLDAIADAQNRARLDKRVDELLAERRATRTAGDGASADCPDCPQMVASQGKGSSKVQLPQTNDAETNGWIKLAEQELKQYLDNQTTYFNLPSNIVPIPCESATESLRVAAGFTGLSDAPSDQQQQYKRVAGDNATYYSRDIRFWPVQLSCKNGKLDGVVDVWAFANMVSDTETFLSVKPSLKHIRFKAEGGKVTGLFHSVARTEGGVNEYKDANTNAMMKKSGEVKLETTIFSYSQPTQKENPRAVTVVNSIFQDKQYQDTSEGPSTIITLPIGPGRTEAVTYNGQRKASRMLYKDGQLHGETIIYASKIRTPAFVPDYKVPASVQCYKEGVLINANPCTVQ
jgi:hypothetical protein